MATESITYDKAQLRGILQAFKGMDEEAVAQAKGVSNGLATYMQSKIISAAGSRPNQAASRIAQGSRVSKSSKIGELSFGFVSQKFSGGGVQRVCVSRCFCACMEMAPRCSGVRRLRFLSCITIRGFLLRVSACRPR